MDGGRSTAMAARRPCSPSAQPPKRPSADALERPVTNNQSPSTDSRYAEAGFGGWQPLIGQDGIGPAFSGDGLWDQKGLSEPVERVPLPAVIQDQPIRGEQHAPEVPGVLVEVRRLQPGKAVQSLSQRVGDGSKELAGKAVAAFDERHVRRHQELPAACGGPDIEGGQEIGERFPRAQRALARGELALEETLDPDRWSGGLPMVDGV